MKYFSEMASSYNMQKSAGEAYQLILGIYSEAALSEKTYRKWMQRFKQGDIENQGQETLRASEKI